MYWMTQGGLSDSDSGLSTKHLPNGMAEVVIHLGDEYARVDKGDGWEHAAEAVIKGLYNKPYQVKLSDKVASFGILFTPEGWVQLFNLPLGDFFNTYHSMFDVHKAAFTELIRLVQDADDLNAAAVITDQFLLKKLATTTFKHQYLIRAAAMIREQVDGVDIDQLSKQLFVSRRTMERHFKEYFGLSPKAYHRVERLNRAIHLAQETQTPGKWTTIAHSLGFSDQAHLIKDFKELTNEVPTVLPQAGSPMHDAYWTHCLNKEGNKCAADCRVIRESGLVPTVVRDGAGRQVCNGPDHKSEGGQMPAH